MAHFTDHCISVHVEPALNSVVLFCLSGHLFTELMSFCLVSQQELRLEDYHAGRKGPTNPMAAGTGSLFGSGTATSSASTGLFGSSAPNSSFSFGQNKSTFGASSKHQHYCLSVTFKLATAPTLLTLAPRVVCLSSSGHWWLRRSHRRLVWSTGPARQQCV